MISQEFVKFAAAIVIHINLLGLRDARTRKYSKGICFMTQKRRNVQLKSEIQE